MRLFLAVYMYTAVDDHVTYVLVFPTPPTYQMDMTGRPRPALRAGDCVTIGHTYHD